MAKVNKVAVLIDTIATIELNGNELAALDALAGYGVDSFIDLFYKHMGRAYLQPHEAGLRSFLSAMRGCGGMTEAARECREFMQFSEKDRRAGLHEADRQYRERFKVARPR